MNSNPEQPLATFLIDRNKQLETELEETREFERDNEKLEERTRYLNGLLTNYVELDKSVGVVHVELSASIEDLVMELDFWMMVSMATVIILVGESIYDLQWGDISINAFVMFIIRVMFLVYVLFRIRILQKNVGMLMGPIKHHQGESNSVKKSNHLFPEIFGPMD